MCNTLLFSLDLVRKVQTSLSLYYLYLKYAIIILINNQLDAFVILFWIVMGKKTLFVRKQENFANSTDAYLYAGTSVYGVFRNRVVALRYVGGRCYRVHVAQFRRIIFSGHVCPTSQLVLADAAVAGDLARREPWRVAHAAIRRTPLALRTRFHSFEQIFSWTETPRALCNPPACPVLKFAILFAHIVGWPDRVSKTLGTRLHTIVLVAAGSFSLLADRQRKNRERGRGGEEIEKKERNKEGRKSFFLFFFSRTESSRAVGVPGWRRLLVIIPMRGR